MAKKRNLLDLYVRGKDLDLDDGGGSLTVWVQKLNPVEHQSAIRGADAARARVLSIKHDRDAEDHQAIWGDILAADPEVLVGVLAAVERGRLGPIVQAELASEKEWSEDNYLDGLRDLWEDELSEKFVDDPEDAEAKRVHDELQSYMDEADKILSDKVDVFEEGLRSMSGDELREAAFTHNIKLQGDVAWITEYHRQEVFFAVRDVQDHRQRMFDQRRDVDDLQAEVFGAIHTALRELTVDPLEGKDLAGRPPSSPSSESSEAEETKGSSGQKESAA